MADVLFSAAASSTANASASAAAAKSEPRADFGVVPYERVLSFDECNALERATRKLGRLDSVVHVWVRDARSFRHGKESEISSFSLCLHPSLPVAEIRDMIQEKFADQSPYREERDGCLTLLFESCVLENDKLFAEYLVPRSKRGASSVSGMSDTASSSGLSASLQGTSSRKQTWAKPFAGIIWVIPFRPVHTTSIDWATPPVFLNKSS